jgi:hypothetical protein
MGQKALVARRALAFRIELNSRAPNGSVVKLHGQGPRAEAEAARRLPACEARDAGGVTPYKLR